MRGQFGERSARGLTKYVFLDRGNRAAGQRVLFGIIDHDRASDDVDFAGHGQVRVAENGILRAKLLAVA